MTTTLSDRAHRWLAALERVPAVPTERVKQALVQADVEPFDAWLSFHERYAGYVEPLGEDTAVLGLMHEQPLATWLPANGVETDYDKADDCWLIACADSHPSHEYQLDQHGMLCSAVTACPFDMYVERAALRWWFCSQGFQPKLAFNVTDPALVARIEAETQPVPEASDDHFVYRIGDRVHAIWEIPKNRWMEVLSV